jgi:hypothetical protein
MSEPAWQSVSSAPPPPPRAERDSAARPSRTTRRPVPPRSARSPAGRAGSPKPATSVDLTERINGFLQGWFAGPLIGAGLALRRRDLLADAGVIADKGPALSAELNNLAQQNPQVAMIIERVTKMGPYGPLLQISMEIITQIATNHRQQLLPITGQFFQAKSLDMLVGTQEQFEEEIRSMFVAAASTSQNGAAGLGADS